MARAIAATVEVEVDAASLRLDGVGIHRCPDEHVVVADPDLATRIVAAIDDALLVASRRRLRRDDACGDCDAALVLPGRRTDTPVPFASPFGVVTPTVVATMVRCPDCGREQLAADARDRLPALVQAAIDRIPAP